MKIKENIQVNNVFAQKLISREFCGGMTENEIKHYQNALQKQFEEARKTARYDSETIIKKDARGKLVYGLLAQNTNQVIIISGLYVKQTKRGLGIAKALIKKYLDYAKKQNKPILIEIDKNQDHDIRYFYEQFGFNRLVTGLTPNNNHLVSEEDLQKLNELAGEDSSYTREELCAFSGIAEEDMTADMMKAVCMLMDQQKKAA
ncbi:GNAT family N-acetyltransferase [Vibrio penaeicida]|uniref:GNAT family N-acetyltransferase n=1 Tax=Vibrio penaeicida TaxID=104609 RepID=UPI001CC5B958|nr:GNAT family N-acetyltransferase [Vibrio penaeicida]